MAEANLRRFPPPSTAPRGEVLTAVANIENQSLGPAQRWKEAPGMPVGTLVSDNAGDARVRSGAVVEVGVGLLVTDQLLDVALVARHID